MPCQGIGRGFESRLPLQFFLIGVFRFVSKIPDNSNRDQFSGEGFLLFDFLLSALKTFSIFLLGQFMGHLNYNAHLLMMLYLFAALLCFFFAGACLEYRKQAAVKVYMAIMAMYTGWLLMNILMIFSPGVEGKEFFARLRFIFITQLPALWIYFGLELFRRPQDQKFKKWTLLFSALPLFVSVACVVPSLRELVVYGAEPFEALGIEAIHWKLGVLGRVHIFYSYALLIVFAGICTYGVRKTGIHKKRYSILLLTVLVFYTVFEVVAIFILPELRFLGTPVLTQIFSSILFFYILHRQQVVQSFSQRSNRFFEALPTPVVLIDSDRRVTLFNSRAASNFGLSMSNVGSPVAEVLPKSMVSSLPAFNEDPTAAMVELTKDSSSQQGRFFEVTCESIEHPVLNGRGHLLVFSDVTDLKRSTQFNQQLMSLISHDLLGNLSSMASLAHHRSEKHWDLISQSAQSSVDLVKNILLWSAAKGDLYLCNKERIMISELVKEAISQVQPALRERNLTVTGNALREGASVEVDIKMFQAILRNLLSNAIKYSPVSSEIEMSVQIQESQVALTVSDRGPGFDPLKMRKILEQGGRRPAGDLATAEGYGIGLFLVSQFLSLHQGRIEFRPDPSWGGRVTVVFPLKG